MSRIVVVTPFLWTLTRPSFSTMNMRPSAGGAQAMPTGRVRPLTVVWSSKPVGRAGAACAGAP
jgi:hypothetical protein